MNGLQTDYAKWRGVSKQRVHALVKEGKIPIDSEGRINFDDADSVLDEVINPNRSMASAFRYGKESKEENVKSTEKDTHSSVALEIRILSRELLRKKNAVLDGQLVDHDEVRKQAFDSARAARNAIFNIRHRLDPLLAAEQDPAKRDALWEQELRSVCEQLAKACGG